MPLGDVMHVQVSFGSCTYTFAEWRKDSIVFSNSTFASLTEPGLYSLYMETNNYTVYKTWQLVFTDTVSNVTAVANQDQCSFARYDAFANALVGQLSASEKGKAVLFVISSSGHLLWMQEVEVAPQAVPFTISAGCLPRGIVLVRVSMADGFRYWKIAII